MSETINRLSDHNGLYSSSRNTLQVLPLDSDTASAAYTASTGWVATYATSASIVAKSIGSTDISRLTRYAMRLAPNLTEDILLTLNSVGLYESDNDSRFSFNALIKPDSTITVSASLQVNGQPAVTQYSQTLYGGRYNTIRSNNVVIPDDGVAHSVSIKIRISGHDAQNIHFTAPNLINDELYYSNIFVSESRRYMPDFYWDLDIAQENPVAPFHKLIDALSHSAGMSYDKYVEIFPFEKSELTSLADELLSKSHSSLVEPLYASEDHLPWLSQFMGTRLKRNITLADGSKLLPSYDVENEYSRWQVNNGYFGIGAGARESMLEATKRGLIFTDDDTDSTYSVAITPRYNGDPFAIRVQTVLNETPDVTISGDSSPTIIALLEDARPLGYKITHTAVSQFYFTIGDDTLGILDSFLLSPPSSASVLPRNYPTFPGP
jgi:hypothetical protein